VREFRGTLFGFLLLAVLGLLFWLTRTEETSPLQEVEIFSFEKHDLQKVEIRKPGEDPLILFESEEGWQIQGTEFFVNSTMINRIKHQLHDLKARATVVDGMDTPELYGLGQNGINVKIELRDGEEIQFLAGDPNPTGVSYYLQPLPGTTVYTVKKSAMDYYSLDFDSFRLRRFAGFDSADVTELKAVYRGESERNWHFNRMAERRWAMLSPMDISADADVVFRMLGRVSALKAQDFLDPEEQEESYGLNTPLLEITVVFGSREPLRLLLGAEIPGNNRQPLSYFQLEGDPVVYIARSGLVEEYSVEPEKVRNRRIVDMAWEDVKSVDVVLNSEDLSGEAGVRFISGQWVWQDGVPVPGSTPKRAAQALTNLSAIEFLPITPENEAHFTDPFAEVKIDYGEQSTSIVIGAEGVPDIDPEGVEHPRRYLRIEGAEMLYLVNEHAVRVLQDMLREHSRKQKADEEKAVRQERIRSSGEGQEQ
jgi:hypothetical protein